MSSLVLVEEFQEVTGGDLTKIGKFAQAAVDAVVQDAVGSGNFFSGANVTQNGAAVINVAPGRVRVAGKTFERTTDTEFTLTSNLPLTLTRIATVVLAGQEIDTDLQPRDYIIDETTGAAEARTAPRERRRTMTVEVIYGAEAVNPVRAVIAPGAVACADVLLSPSGVVTITMLTANKLRSMEELRSDIIALEGFRENAGARIDSLATDIADLTQRTQGIISPHIHRRMIRDISRLKRREGLSDLAQSYSFDYFLNRSGSAPTHPLWLARVEEGIRFPAAQERIALLRPLNPADPKLRRSGGFVLPAYTDNTRISVVGNDGELSISQFQHQTTIQVQKSISRSATRYGPSYTTCTNRAEFYNGTYNEISQTLQRDGETFNVEFTGRDFDPNNNEAGDHLEVRLQQVWTDSWTETYWEAQTITEGLNGSVIGQTFLNANAGWMIYVNLFFNRVDTSGDVHVLITEITPSGSPAPEKTLAKVTVPAANLRAWPQATRVDFLPTHLAPGRRYGIVLITGGNHHIATISGNKFAEGTLFHSTDQAWFQGDLNRDMAFEVGFAKFDRTRIEVDFEALELENGIANVKFLTVGATPQSTKLVWEYKKDGIWYPVNTIGGENSATPLLGLPALLQLRAVFLGSTDDMPGLDVGLSQYNTWRPRTDFRWISQLFDLGAGITTTQVQVDLRVEAYNEAIHDCTISLLAGAGETVETADSVVVEPDPFDPKAFTFKCVFNLAAPTRTYRIRVDGVTNSAVATFHGAALFQQAL